MNNNINSWTHHQVITTSSSHEQQYKFIHIIKSWTHHQVMDNNTKSSTLIMNNNTNLSTSIIIDSMHAMSSRHDSTCMWYQVLDHRRFVTEESHTPIHTPILSIRTTHRFVYKDLTPISIRKTSWCMNMSRLDNAQSPK